MKELKDDTSAYRNVTFLAVWNPVKELKVYRRVLPPLNHSEWIVESGEGIERSSLSTIDTKTKLNLKWNPVKELKDFNSRSKESTMSNMWNPVKELKAKKARNKLMAQKVSWNPVKELKVRQVQQFVKTDSCGRGIR